MGSGPGGRQHLSHTRCIVYDMSSSFMATSEMTATKPNCPSEPQTIRSPSTPQKNFDDEERAFLKARNQVSDEELVARMNAAPNLGGELLVTLSQFVSRRSASATKHSRKEGDGT